MQQDLVNKVIGTEAVDEVTKFTEMIVNLQNRFVELYTLTSKGLQIGGDAKTLLEAATQAEELKARLEQLRTANNSLSTATAQLNEQTRAMGTDTAALVRALVDETVRMNQAKEAAANLNKQMEVMNALGSRGAAARVELTKRLEEEAVKYKAAETAAKALNDQIKFSIEYNKAAEGSVTRMKLELEALTKQYNALTEAERGSSFGQGLAGQISGLDTQVKQIEANLAGFKSLNAELSEVRRQMGLLSAASLEGGAEWNRLKDRAQELVVTIERVKQATKLQREEWVYSDTAIVSLEARLKELRVAYSQLSDIERGAGSGIAMKTEIDQLSASIENLKASGIQTISAELSDVKTKMAELVAAGQEGSAEFQALTVRGKELSASLERVKAALSDPKILTSTAELAAIREEMRRLSLAGQQTSARYEELQQRALQLTAAQKEVTDATRQVAVAHLTVGQELSQVRARMAELILAGQQNSAEYRDLRDRARELAVAQAEVAAATKAAEASTSPAIKGFKGLYSVLRQAAYILPGIGISGILLISFEAIKSLFDYISGMKEVVTIQTALAEVAKKSDNTFTQEATHLELLKARFDDVATSMNAKKEIVDELNEKFSNQIGKIDGVSEAEKFFRDKTPEMLKALALRAEATAALSVLTENAAKRLKLLADPTGDITGFQKVGAAAKGFFGYLGNLANGLGGAGTAGLTEEYEGALQEAGANIADKQLNKLYDMDEYLKKVFIDAQNKANALDQKLGIDTDQKGKKAKAGKGTGIVGSEYQADIAANKKYLEELAKLRQDEYKEDAENNRKIFEDETQSLSDRINAHKNYVNDLKLILLDQKNAEISVTKERIAALQQEEARNDGLIGGGKLKSSQIEGLRNKNKAIADEIKALNVQEVRLERDKKAEIAKIDADALTAALQIVKTNAERQKKIRLDGLTDEKAAIEAGYNEDVLALQRQYQNKEISATQYEAKLKALHTKNLLDLAQADIDYYKKEQERTDLLLKDKVAAHQKEIAAERTKNDILLALEQQLVASKKAAEKDLLNEIVTNTDSALKAVLSRQQATNEQHKSDLENEAQAEIDAVNISLATKKDKEDRIRAINERVQRDKQELDERNRRLSKQQAEVEAIAAMIRVGANTFEKVAAIQAQAAVLSSNPVTAALAALAYSQIPIVYAAGAVAEAGILAQLALQKYAEGTTDSGDRGLRVVGDANRAEVIETNGKYFVTPDRPTIVDMPAHSIVHKSMQDFITDMQARSLMGMGAMMPAVVEAKGDERLLKEIKGLRRDLSNQKAPNIHIRTNDRDYLETNVFH